MYIVIKTINKFLPPSLGVFISLLSKPTAPTVAYDGDVFVRQPHGSKLFFPCSYIYSEQGNFFSGLFDCTGALYNENCSEEEIFQHKKI